MKGSILEGDGNISLKTSLQSFGWFPCKDCQPFVYMNKQDLLKYLKKGNATKVVLSRRKFIYYFDKMNLEFELGIDNKDEMKPFLVLLEKAVEDVKGQMAKLDKLETNPEDIRKEWENKIDIKYPNLDGRA